jgi:glucosamine-6-phosphate deaminase
MQVIIRPNADAAADLAAGVIARNLREEPGLVLGLATGRTMEPVYARLVQMHRKEGLDFSNCHTFNLDEYIGLPAQHQNSYRRYMNQHLFEHVNIKLENTHLPNGLADDLETECAAYERLIRKHGGIDLQLLGIGRNGHLGFNEPPSGLYSLTRVEALSPVTRQQNEALFESPDQMPQRAITMGLGTILDCRRCILLATGGEKAAVVAETVESPITSMIPATALQLHPECVLILDEAAGAQLKDSGRYRRIFDNEPQWESFRRARTPVRANGISAVRELDKQ